MTGIIKTDQLQGAQSSTITVPSGNNLTVGGALGVTGVLTGTSLDISGNIDVDGTSNLDVVDIDGAVDMASTLGLDGALSAKGGAVFNENSADVDFRVETNNNANTLFVDGGTDKVYIGRNVSDGLFAAGLQVEGNDGNYGAISVHRNGGNPYFSMSASGGSSLGDDTLLSDGDGVGTIYWSGADGTDRASGVAYLAAFVDGTPGSNDMPGRLVFATTADGSSSPTERMRIHSGGVVSIPNGIALGVGTANTASNVLDDYEEGSWTPSLGGNTAYNSQVGKYTKIGNLVTIMCNVYVNTQGTGSVSQISGLPFTVSNITEYNANGSSHVAHCAGLAQNVSSITPAPMKNATTIRFFFIAAGGGNTNAQNNNVFQNGTDMYFTCTYRTG